MERYMTIGVKRGTVELHNHNPEWATLAAESIQRLWGILGDAAVDIQHVGSTAIPSIKAKPIIDIAVAVRDFGEVMALSPVLKKNGFMYRKRENHGEESLLFACGDYSRPDGIVTHFIHVVKSDSIEFINYLNFRDYMNTHSDEAKAYETLKIQLMVDNPIDPGREKYLAGKKGFIIEKLNLARLWDEFGRRFTTIERINKGWSCDKKYCVAEKVTKFLLRITPLEKSASRKDMFEMMQRVSALGVPMCQPISFGACADGVFSLQSWIEGEDLEDALPLLSETEQYALGLQSGEILRAIHAIPAPDTQEEWAVRFGRKTDHKIKQYHECGVRFQGDDAVISYLEQNRALLENRPQCFQHGDYHVGNMMLENGDLRIIDFDRYDFGDPWEEFNRIVWCAQKSPHFATGQLHGYFGGEPPVEFFKLLAFYIGSNMLSSIYWALGFDDKERETMLNQVKDVLSWYDNMSNSVPTWYLKDFCT